MLGDSFRRQWSAAKAYAARHGLALDETLTFRDMGVSGFKGANVQRGDPLKGDGRNPLNHARTSLPSRTIRGSRAGSFLQEQYKNIPEGPENPNRS
ncbi:hypothetical protein JQ589_07050 [Bradyrhizobium japonicum]|nr:hypothetical protein [Bradyrhizobium japonicum]